MSFYSDTYFSFNSQDTTLLHKIRIPTCYSSNDSMVMSESDIYILKDTLHAQQKLLQKLYNELDAEREASASAASEALSVILRLQGEKAALKMEAEQYKRLSEEKMSHAEESLAITEDIMYQKEMEVAALNCQVQAYRYKLLSMGCVDPDDLLRRTANLARCYSAPLALKYKNEVNERESCSVQKVDLVSRIIEKTEGEEKSDQSSDSDKKLDDSYWEQIRRLDVRVKNLKSGTISPSSVSSRMSSRNLCSEIRSPSPEISISNRCNETDRANCSEDLLQSSPSICDVFEVPQADQSSDSCEPQSKGEVFRDRYESTHSKKILHEPSDVDPIHCHLALVQTRTSVSECGLRLDRFNGTSEIVEVEGPVESENREEELKLLNEIKEQICSLRDEIISCEVKKSSPRDELSLCGLREVLFSLMTSFFLVRFFHICFR